MKSGRGLLNIVDDIIGTQCQLLIKLKLLYCYDNTVLFNILQGQQIIYDVCRIDAQFVAILLVELLLTP